MTCLTPIWHIEIARNGRSCLRCFTKYNWHPTYGAARLAKVFVSMLSEPDDADIENQEAGREFRQNRALYEQTAKEWTEKYAM